MFCEWKSRCLVASWESTVQPQIVFGTLCDAFRSAASFLLLVRVSFLHSRAASTSLSEFRLAFLKFLRNLGHPDQ